ncbi:MAG: hypothetical protein IJR87_01370 [Bacteroidaceae bacterium]|nr:hypothetical protein [Bacteroidaceae bacterium]
MNIRAKQLASLDVTRMDITTVLGFFMQIKGLIMANNALATALSTVWTAFTDALTAFDNAYAQTRKWMQTEDLKELDDARDTSLRGFINALKAMLATPNAEKAAAARRVQFVREKYSIDAADEYMKETSAISQMVQEMEAGSQADLALLGLDEWLADLKSKNEAFLAKMNERTDEQAGMQKGIVRDTRLQVEAAYRDVVKLLNAMAICEVPAGLDFNAPIDRLNAEIEHYRQILARKGGGSGSGSSSGSGSGSGSEGGSASSGSGSEGSVSGSGSEGSGSEGGSGSSGSGSEGSGSGSGSEGSGSGDSGSGSGSEGSGSGDSGSGSGSEGSGSGDSGSGSGSEGGGGGYDYSGDGME